MWHEVFFFIPVTGYKFPVTRNKFPVTRNKFPVTGAKFPVKRNKFPLTGNKFPVTRRTNNTSCRRKDILLHRKYTSCGRLKSIFDKSCHWLQILVDYCVDDGTIFSLFRAKSFTGKLGFHEISNILPPWLLLYFMFKSIRDALGENPTFFYF